MDDLSVCLTQCKAGCQLNEAVTNHVMYADAIGLMVPSAIALHKMLNLRYEFRQFTDIILNPIKSQYVSTTTDSNCTAQLCTWMAENYKLC